MEKTHDALLGDIAGLIAKIAKHNTEYSNYCIAASVTPLFRKSTLFSFNHCRIRHWSGS